MIPFLHIGALTLGTYGMMIGTAMVAAYYLLRADLQRRDLRIRAGLLIIAVCGAGLVAAKLYAGIESPGLLRHPSSLISGTGFTFYGAVIGAVAVIWIMARYYELPALLLFDVISAPAALGYGIGRIGCLLSGDGDYGTPTSLPWGMSFPQGLVPTLQRVHPTPIYETLGALLITLYLWRLGRAASRGAIGPGVVFANYLLWTGLARFLVEFIRINPRVYAGLTNAQLMAIASMAGGAVLLTVLRPGRPRQDPLIHPGGSQGALHRPGAGRSPQRIAR